MHRKAVGVSSALVMMMLLGLSPARAEIIDASRLVSTLGAGFRPQHPLAWGQTFTPPSGSTKLTTFDLWMGLNTISGFPETLLPFSVRAYVQRWEESDPNFGSAVGDLLAVSDSVRVDNLSTVDPTTLTRLSFSLNAPVTPGDRYVTFVSALGFTDERSRAGFGLGRLGLSFVGFDETRLGDDYAGGHLVTGEIVGSRATNSSWCRGPGCNFEKLDVTFVATFTPDASPIPEPSALLLLTMGGITTLWHRKRATRRNCCSPFASSLANPFPK